VYHGEFWACAILLAHVSTSSGASSQATIVLTLFARESWKDSYSPVSKFKREIFESYTLVCSTPLVPDPSLPCFEACEGGIATYPKQG
jgi:hypothetical protein